MKEKKEKKRWGLILFIVIIMLGTSVSFVFFGYQPQSQAVKYNGIKFASSGNFWTADINGKYAAFTFLPADLENIRVPDSLNFLQGKYEIDSTSEVNSTFKETIAVAQYQMGLTLQEFNIYLRKGFTANTSFSPSVPIIACSNATQDVPVILFIKSNSTNINVEGNCVYAEALTNTDVIRIKDRMLYGILGVMK